AMRFDVSWHDPFYLRDSQDLDNPVSFGPRHDEFIERPAGPQNPDQQTYTEESGVNLFTGRGALYVQDAARKNVPHNIRAAFTSADRAAQIEVRRFGKTIRTWDVYLCRNYRTLPL